jgi:hypothetical protein
MDQLLHLGRAFHFQKQNHRARPGPSTLRSIGTGAISAHFARACRMLAESGDTPEVKIVALFSRDKTTGEEFKQNALTNYDTGDMLLGLDPDDDLPNVHKGALSTFVYIHAGATGKLQRTIETAKFQIKRTRAREVVVDIQFSPGGLSQLASLGYVCHVKMRWRTP